jgi:hypothetical protein
MKLLVLLAATLLLPGCGGVECENPASDEAATKHDERLVGFWRLDHKASGMKDDEVSGDAVFAVGRQRDERGPLALAIVILDKGVLQVEQVQLRATTIGTKPYVSMGGAPKADEKQGGWGVMRYDVPEEGTLRVLAMNEGEVAKDIQAGKIAGTVKEAKLDNPGGTTMVAVSATIDALRAYLASRGDAVFKADKPLVLKRVGLR